MKKRYKSKRRETLISALLVIAMLLGVIGFAISFTGKETRTISALSFVKGDLDTSGKYKKSDTAVYTEDMFACQGLIVEPDFESVVKYRVHYYRQDGSYIGSTELLSSSYEKDESFNNAKYARVVVYPTLNSEKIRFWEITTYAKTVTITVNKDQTFESVTYPIFDDVLDYLDTDAEFYSSFAVVRADAPFVLANDKLTAFEGKHITKIGVPVKLIKDPTKDNVFTLRLVEGDGSSAFKTIKTYSLTIPANTFSNLEEVTELEASIPEGSYELSEGFYHEMYEGWYKVNEWYYFDVNIDVKVGQTLAYGDQMDTVSFSYLRNADLGYGIYSAALRGPGGPINTLSVLMDVRYEE